MMATMPMIVATQGKPGRSGLASSALTGLSYGFGPSLNWFIGGKYMQTSEEKHAALLQILLEKPELENAIDYLFGMCQAIDRGKLNINDLTAGVHLAVEEGHGHLQICLSMMTIAVEKAEKEKANVAAT